ncbi:MAG: sugar transferase [Candidatus Latescibacterota bacterium]
MPRAWDARRVLLLEQLHGTYGRATRGIGRARLRLRFWWGKYSLIAAVVCPRLTKRAFDVLVSGLLLLALLPLFAVVAALIKVRDGGPVLFWQVRIGQYGRAFRFPKFRSMVVNAERLKDGLLAQNQHGSGITFKIKRDPRVTGIGRIIRRLSIDELPQLWCVLRGDMSLVGPRPPVPREVNAYTLRDRRRLEATPGLTCIWQVAGRAEIPFDEQVQLDVEYIERWSLWLDLRLVLKTVPAVLGGKGAY